MGRGREVRGEEGKGDERTQGKFDSTGDGRWHNKRRRRTRRRRRRRRRRRESTKEGQTATVLLDLTRLSVWLHY